MPAVRAHLPLAGHLHQGRRQARVAHHREEARLRRRLRARPERLHLLRALRPGLPHRRHRHDPGARAARVRARGPGAHHGEALRQREVEAPGVGRRDAAERDADAAEAPEGRARGGGRSAPATTARRPATASPRLPPRRSGRLVGEHGGRLPAPATASAPVGSLRPPVHRRSTAPASLAHCRSPRPRRPSRPPRCATRTRSSSAAPARRRVRGTARGLGPGSSGEGTRERLRAGLRAPRASCWWASRRIRVVTSRDLVRAVLWLAVTLLGTAVLYALLQRAVPRRRPGAHLRRAGWSP